MAEIIKGMWRAVSAVALIASSIALAQQAPPSPTELIAKQRKESSALAAEWLQSRDAKTRAWGAYLVLRDRLKERVPDLMQLLENYEVVGGAASLSEVDDHDAMLAVLDALIQMGADVPVATAARIYPEFRAQSMILMIQSSADATAELLEIFQTEMEFDGEWLAAGNQLITMRPAGFAAAVLGGMTVRETITVTSGGVFGQGFGGGFGGGLYREPRAAGWPEIGNYSFSACGQSTGVILVPGVHPAYYQRSVNNWYNGQSESQCSEVNLRDEIRADYLGTLLSFERGNQPIPKRVRRSITFNSNEDYLKELSSFIDEQQSLYAQVAQRLYTAGLLAQSESGTCRPHLNVNVVDAREKKTTPLPTLAAPAANVTFSSL